MRKRRPDGTFGRFRDALKLYDEHVDAFAFDIMSMAKDPDWVGKIAEAYVRSGKYKTWFPLTCI
jgi:hypothetical protein